MKKRVLLTLITFAFMLACGAAVAEESLGMRGREGHAMMGQGGMMGCGMMERGGMMGGGGMMGHGAGMRFIFALMDSDGDGTVSLQEFQAAHEKIFGDGHRQRRHSYHRGDTSLYTGDWQICSEGTRTRVENR